MGRRRLTRRASFSPSSGGGDEGHVYVLCHREESRSRGLIVLDEYYSKYRIQIITQCSVITLNTPSNVSLSRTSASSPTAVEVLRILSLV